MNAALVRLRAHWNSRVEVPDLADTEGPVTESNCIGAIPPGGEQLEVNHQSVTASARMGGQSELDSVGGSGELATAERSPNKIERPALRQWNASGREPQMVGDRMVGSSGDVNQGTTVGDDQRADRKALCSRSACPVWEGGGAPCAPPILIATARSAGLHSAWAER